MAIFKKSSAVLSSLVVLGLAVSSLPASVANAASITVTATIRDFSSSHADFQQGVGLLETGIVLSTLGVDGKPVYNEAVKGVTGASSTTTNGTANFNQWYNDTPGINHTFTTSLVATEAVPGSGVYTYADPSYFPIDGLGFGNEGNGNNFHFTTEINTQFTYVGGETFVNGGVKPDQLGGVKPDHFL